MLFLGALSKAGGPVVRGVRAMSGEYVNKCLIDGEFVPAESGKTFETVNPATGKKITDVAEGDAADIDKAVAAARRQFDGGPWSELSGEERGHLLYRLADLMEQNADALAYLDSIDNGKPLAVARAADVPLSIQNIRYYAGYADKIEGKVLEAPQGFFSYTRHEPVGVCGQIIPWNFPLLMQAWKLGPALAAGCTIVMKPAEQTPLSALKMGELIQEAGFPGGVVNLVPGFGPTAGGRLVEHPGVDKIAFTGSTDVGKEIMRKAADTMKRVTLELGGKSPNIVLADADLDAAVEGAHEGLFFNSGETCCAGTRIFVQEDVYDEFVAKSVERAKNRTVGDPSHPNTQQGPQVSEEQMNKILSYINTGKSEGANLLVGGNRVGTEGYFVAPTLFGDVTDDMKIAREEIFGPVGAILKFKTIDEVVARANDSNYGLAAAVWTKDGAKAHSIAHRLRAGTVWLNCFNIFSASLPFGGFKESGIGREMGEYALRAYTEVKCVTNNIQY